MKRSPMRPVSRKQAAKNREYARTRIEALERDGYACQLRTAEHRCEGMLQTHHIVRRSQGGSNDAANLVTLCAAGHAWVHANPQAAADLGLLSLRAS